MSEHRPLPGHDVVVTPPGGRPAGRPVRLHVVTHGDADAPTIVLLHGLPTSGQLWDDVARDLGRHHRLVVPDLPGLGRSERPGHGGYHPAAQAAAVLGLLDRLGTDRAAIVGHDLGGMVAVHLAALAPERVRALVLLDAPLHPGAWPAPPVRPLLLPFVGEVYAGALARSPELAHRVLTAALGAGERPEAVRPHLGHLLDPDGVRGLLGVVRAVDLVATEAAWRLVCADPPPTLVLWGRHDHLHPAERGAALAAECPGAVLVTVEDAGHLLPVQRPERVAEEIAGFLGELPVG